MAGVDQAKWRNVEVMLIGLCFKHKTLFQALTLSGVLFCSISDGFIFGQMSGMLADLQSKNSTIPLGEDDVSWIGKHSNSLHLSIFTCQQFNDRFVTLI